LTALTALAAALPALAVDHNNIDEGRPLGFDDAEAIAYRERSVEGGLVLRSPQGHGLGLQGHPEFLYGFALDSHASIGVSPAIGGRSDSERTSFDVGDVTLSAFHNFNREVNGTPAFSVRGDLFLPSGRDSRGVGFRVRGILSRKAGQYGRLHLNLDLDGAPSADRGERRYQPGLILGYSRPLGYPRQFHRTGVAEVGVRSGARSGTGAVIHAGLGLRQQVTVRSVFDVGVEADVAGFDGAPRDRARLIAGYSVGY
jgi:hypothetical protein